MKYAVAVFFLTSPLLAQGTEAISGQILLNDQPPGSRASTVQVELHVGNRSGEPMRTMVSPEGEYRFVNLKVGLFIVVARAPGYQPAKTEVETMGGNQTRGNTRLVLVPEQSLPQGKQTASVVSQNELRAPKKAVKDVEDAEKALEVGDLEKAAKALDRALALYPEYGRAIFQQGRLLEKQNKSDEAILKYELALHNDSGWFPAYRPLADAYRSKRDFARLQELSERWKRAQPMEATPYLYVAVSLYERGEYALAVNEGLAASQLPHDHLPDLNLFLANCYNKLRNPQAAAQQLRDFLERWPNHPAAPQVRASLETLEKSVRP
jgi:tetratricopeptide (TPR) repeat protein